MVGSSIGRKKLRWGLAYGVHTQAPAIDLRTRRRPKNHSLLDLIQHVDVEGQAFSPAMASVQAKLVALLVNHGRTAHCREMGLGTPQLRHSTIDSCWMRTICCTTAAIRHAVFWLQLVLPKNVECG